jgi:hypothetical protein
MKHSWKEDLKVLSCFAYLLGLVLGLAAFIVIGYYVGLGVVAGYDYVRDNYGVVMAICSLFIVGGFLGLPWSLINRWEKRQKAKPTPRVPPFFHSDDADRFHTGPTSVSTVFPFPRDGNQTRQ